MANLSTLESGAKDLTRGEKFGCLPVIMSSTSIADDIWSLTSWKINGEVCDCSPMLLDSVGDWDGG